MTATWMPPLPEPVSYYWTLIPKSAYSPVVSCWSSNPGPHPDWHVARYFSDDQMRARDAEVAHAALERAAKVSQNERFVYSDEEWRIRCELADAIRELAKEIT